MESTSDINGHARAETGASESETTRSRSGATIPPGSELLIANMNLLSGSSFSDSEQRAINLLLRKMRDGSRKHGSLNLITDGRDWREEKLGELTDWLWYELFDQVQAELRKAGGG